MVKVLIKTGRKTSERKTRRREDDDIVTRLNKLEETVEKLLKKVEEIENQIGYRRKRFVHVKGYKVKTAKRGEVEESGGKRSEKKRSAIEIMKEQGVLFESDLKNISNKDKFFYYLSRHGIHVFEGLKERVAVTDEFLDKFVEMLENCRTPSEAEEKLRGEYRRLYQVLRESGYLVYGRDGWELTTPS